MQILKTAIASILITGMVAITPVRRVDAVSLAEQTVLAALAVNLVRFTTWPPELLQTKDSIDFCVIGDNVVQSAFADSDGKSFGSYQIQIVELSRMRNYELCQVLYVNELRQDILLQLFSEVKNQPLLTIGSGAKFAKLGGMVGLENDGGKMKLHVNLTALRQAKLLLSAKILKLANIVED